MEMMECKAGNFTIYFEGAFPGCFRDVYRGVVVNARGYGGHGHFAIRKPIPFWSKFPKFIKKMIHYECYVEE